jgi:hypothetical protein
MMADKEYAKAAAGAEKILQKNFVDLTAHKIAARAYKEMGKETEAKFHRKVFAGLFQSILKSGDGKSAATAYVVISTDEEYVVLGELGIRRTKQALLGEKGQKIDLLEGVNSKNEPVALYFNVSAPFRWLERQFKKGD